MIKSPDNRKALGKGLSALLPPRALRSEAPAAVESQPSGPVRVSISRIEPNPVQPRTIFQPERLAELAHSIKANGIIQPLVVQKIGERYQLVAGERRWRAAKLAGLTEVPVVVQEFANDRLLEIALVENIQREDLNPIEVARALDQLSNEHSLSHEEIGQRTGKDRTTVTNLLRLLKLPEDIQLLVAEHRLSMGHARAILALPTVELQREVAQRTVSQSLSVRQVERLIQSMTSKREPAAPLEKGDTRRDPNVEAATRELEAALGTRVRIIAASPDRGKIEIEYFSFEELDRLYNLIVGAK